MIVVQLLCKELESAKGSIVYRKDGGKSRYDLIYETISKKTEEKNLAPFDGLPFSTPPFANLKRYSMIWRYAQITWSVLFTVGIF